MTNYFGAPLAVALQDGIAHNMGDGLFVVLQKDETVRRNPVQNVVVAQKDLERLQASQTLTISLGDGKAENAGDGYWRLLQMDHEAKRMQNVVLTGQDVEALLKAA